MNQFLNTAALVVLAALSSSPAHAEATFDSLTCRAYDYFELGGDRKTLEILVAKQATGKYKLTVSRTFDVLQPNHDYLERNRYAETEMTNLNCVQAPGSVDPKVITCTGATLKSYFNLSRLERTLIKSELSITPQRIIKTITYEASVYGQQQNEYKDFNAENCVLN